MAVFFCHAFATRQLCHINQILGMAKRITLSDGSTINSKGFRVELSGMDLQRFSKNPVMLYEHQRDKVIGRWENYSITANKLSADPVFDTKNEDAAEIARQYDEDFLRAASISIIVYEMKEVDDVWTVTKCELLEASIVAIPADSGAVVLYNENLEAMTFEQLQLSFNNNKSENHSKNQNEMAFTLSQKTMESLGLSGEITPKDVELAVAEKDKEIATLKSNQVNEYLSNAVKVGKIKESEKEDFLALAADDAGFARVKKIIDQKPESASASLADKVEKSNLTAGRENWTYMDWATKDSAGLKKLRHESPAEFERLVKTTENK